MTAATAGPTDEIVTYHPVCDPSADYDYECDCPVCQPLSEQDAAEIGEAYPLPPTLFDEGKPITDCGPESSLHTRNRRDSGPAAEPCAHRDGA